MIGVGKISVKAILKHQRRNIDTLYMKSKKTDRDFRYIQELARNRKVDINYVDDRTLTELAQTQSHGGVVIRCGSRIFDEIVHKEVMTYLCVEGLTDPYNMGEVMRTIAALGFDGIITPVYDFYDSEAKLIRASAGASESLIWHQSPDLALTLESLTKQSVDVVGAYRGEDATSLVDFDFGSKTCIVIGGAYRGLSRAVLDQCTQMVKLETQSRVALSTVGAVSVFAYEIYRRGQV